MHLVRKAAGAGTGVLRQVACLGMDTELAAYIERRLTARWPAVEVSRVALIEDLQAYAPQLVFAGIEPAIAPGIPALWLGEVDRRAYPLRLSEWVWKSAAPVTGGSLLRWVEAMLAAQSARATRTSV